MTVTQLRAALTALVLAASAARAQTTPTPEPETPKPVPSAPPLAPAPTVPTPTHAPVATTPAPTAPVAPAATGDFKDVISKFDLTLYGFAELDSIFDSTQSLNDLAGNPVIAKAGTYAGDHGRVTFSVRNSRIGFKLKAPAVLGIKSSATIEADFFGNQPGSPNTAISEGAFFANPGLRVRHAYLKLESDVVDVTLGQTWNLFGWQPYFFPNTADLQGLPGQLFQRTPQIRVSHTFKTDPVNIEIAAAANRPAQRDAAVPDGVGGVRVFLNDVTGYHTITATTSQVDALALGISGIARRFDVPEFKAAPKGDLQTVGYGVSADVFVPVIPASKSNHDNALSLMGEIVYGNGTSDGYAGFNAGASFPTLPNPAAASPAPAYIPDVDNGLLSFTPGGAPQTIQWSTALAGVQYYVPGDMFWLSGTISYAQSDNVKDFGAAAKVYDKMLFAEGSLWCDVTSAVRLGLAYDFYHDTFADDSDATNHRVQLSAFFIF
ncbi:MAG TPA: hypothetical protein VGO62_06395 [Myxococcota bacterium]|jgi:hypothetical protein